MDMNPTSLFWLLLAISLTSTLIGYLATVFDEYEAHHYGWHKRQIQS
jgi:hypothetical protein